MLHSKIYIFNFKELLVHSFQNISEVTRPILGTGIEWGKPVKITGNTDEIGIQCYKRLTGEFLQKKTKLSNILWCSGLTQSLMRYPDELFIFKIRLKNICSAEYKD